MAAAISDPERTKERRKYECGMISMSHIKLQSVLCYLVCTANRKKSLKLSDSRGVARDTHLGCEIF